MFQPQRLRFDPQILVDYVSPQGPQVTDIRGVLIQSRLKQLREHELFDDYAARLPAQHKDSLLNALASSWVPVGVGVAHFEALDSMQLSEAQLTRMAEPLGVGMVESLFASVVRAVRAAGAEYGIWIGLKAADRVFGRMYQGGACRVSQVGPKDATVEIRGVPYARSRCFRISHCGFMRGIFAVTTKACIVKPMPQQQSDGLTVSLSWV
jgi:hypothetical protein